MLPVSAVRRETAAPVLPAFDDLRPWLAAAIGRITEHNNNPVLVINSDTEIQQQQLDFDRYSEDVPGLVELEVAVPRSAPALR